MTKFIPTALIITLLGIGGFGFVVLSHDNGMSAGHTDCFAARAQSGLCPEMASAASFIFHANALKIFSTASFKNLLYSLIFFSALWSVSAIFAGAALPAATRRRTQLKSHSIFIPKNLAVLLRWQARHEMSPSVF